LRVSSNSKAGRHTLTEANLVLAALASHPGYRFWPILKSWKEITAPFQDRIYGHQQIADAFLLGLAVEEDGVLVTMDKAIQFLAGKKFRKNLLVLA
jgi:predicted nucleic acid-binding protein